jgi:hypothetical protein
MNLRCVLVIVLTLTGCCMNNIDVGAFADATLQAQIREYARANEHECVGSKRQALLSAISRHGDESIEAMSRLIETPNPHFPLIDVLTVVRYAQSSGADLRQHRIYEQIRLLASDGDSRVRKAALGILVR